MITHPSKQTFYHLAERQPSNGQSPDLVAHFLEVFAAILQHSNYRPILDIYARTSSKCGRCAVACQVFQASQDPRDVPCYRSSLLLDIYRHYFTPGARWPRACLLLNHLPKPPSTKWRKPSIAAPPAVAAS